MKAPGEENPRASVPFWTRPGIRLAGAVLLYIAVTLAARLGLGRALAALLDAWNVNAETAALAPAWARLLYAWQGSLVSAASAAAVIALAVAVYRVRIPKPEPAAVRWWLAGTAMALLSAALFLLMDSLRPEWPLSAPRLSAGLLALWLLSLLTAFSEELFTKCVLMESVSPRWGMVWAVLAFFLINGGYSGTTISGINVALMGVLCAVLYQRHGLWADVAFRWGWSFAAVFLLGQGGGDLAVYRLYGVSENGLTGGDRGLAYGLWLTLLLCLMIARLILAGRKKGKNEGNPLQK